MTHCKHGHKYDETNTYRKPGFGWRQCRQCNLEAVRAYQQRKRDGLVAAA